MFYSSSVKHCVEFNSVAPLLPAHQGAHLSSTAADKKDGSCSQVEVPKRSTSFSAQTEHTALGRLVGWNQQRNQICTLACSRCFDDALTMV
jgi:hypothetical protein